MHTRPLTRKWAQPLSTGRGGDLVGSLLFSYPRQTRRLPAREVFRARSPIKRAPYCKLPRSRSSTPRPPYNTKQPVGPMAL